MEIVGDLSELDAGLRGGAVTIGNFDGVHSGHARLIECLREKASKLSGPAVAFTFDPHPVRLLRPDEAPPPLTWTARKAELLAELGIDAIVVYPTDEQLLMLDPQEFYQRIVREALGARAMVEGPNFFFGRNRSGNTELLASLCADHQVELEVVQPLEVGGQYVSSSRIRQLVREGDLGQVRTMLTQPYRIRGMVTHGAARGARIGFPTANVAAVDTLLPAQGVYAGRAYENHSIWPAAINIGPNPTFGDERLKVEAHLIGFTGSLYGQPLEVDFLSRLRDIRPFATVEELRAQLRSDVAAAQRVLRDFDEEGPH